MQEPLRTIAKYKNIDIKHFHRFVRPSAEVVRDEANVPRQQIAAKQCFLASGLQVSSNQPV